MKKNSVNGISKNKMALILCAGICASVLSTAAYAAPKNDTQNSGNYGKVSKDSFKAPMNQMRNNANNNNGNNAPKVSQQYGQQVQINRQTQNPPQNKNQSQNQPPVNKIKDRTPPPVLNTNVQNNRPPVTTPVTGATYNYADNNRPKNNGQGNNNQGNGGWNNNNHNNQNWGNNSNRNNQGWGNNSNRNNQGWGNNSNRNNQNYNNQNWNNNRNNQNWNNNRPPSNNNTRKFEFSNRSGNNFWGPHGNNWSRWNSSWGDPNVYARRWGFDAYDPYRGWRRGSTWYSNPSLWSNWGGWYSFYFANNGIWGFSYNNNYSPYYNYGDNCMRVQTRDWYNGGRAVVSFIACEDRWGEWREVSNTRQFEYWTY